MKYAVVAAAIVGAVSAAPADEWNTWSSSSTTTSTDEWNTWKPTTTPAAQWSSVDIKTKEKCSYETTWVTTEYDDKNEWATGKVVTKTSTVYTDAEKCTWAPWPTTTPAAEWSSVDIKTKEKCSYTSTYLTTEYDDKKEWETAKVVTKTTVIYTDADKCTWAPWSSSSSSSSSGWNTWSSAASSSSAWNTWSSPAATSKTPAAASKTPAAAAASSSSAEWNTWKASSTVSAPVSKWTGAADKNTFAMGALAVAGLAALL